MQERIVAAWRQCDNLAQQIGTLAMGPLRAGLIERDERLRVHLARLIEECLRQHPEVCVVDSAHSCDKASKGTAAMCRSCNIFRREP